MCGIAGIVALTPGARPPSREALQRMAGALAHRGPDEFGLYRDGRAGLSHARLSIIDLAFGQQPLCNEDRTLWVVFNGEIFNYVELREELLALGHVFRTRSDTEVLVHAWEAWGEAGFAKMNGQWALALWDARRERLVLARDRVGVRPLHYAEHDGRLLFGSEVKALFAGDPSFPRRLDPLGLDETFTFWSVVPPRTNFVGVRELEPGHVRTWERGQLVSDRAFWTPSYPRTPAERFQGTVEDGARALSAALENASRLRMVRADVPVGSYLSGGLDSSVVAALAARAKPEGFETFSLRFADAEYDETPYQRAMVERLGTRHHELVVTRARLAEVLPEVVRHTERPVLRTAPAAMFLLSGLVRETGIKVVLTGEGADEVLGGYDLFREARVRRFWARRPASSLRPRLLERLYPYLARSPVAQQATARQFFGRDLAQARAPGFGHFPRWHAAAALKRLFHPEVKAALAGVDAIAALVATVPPDFARWNPLSQDEYLEIRTLLSGYLLSSQGDRMLMGHSVEGRFPFLDAEVLALAASFPPSFHLQGLDEKHVLKRAARGLVPREILERTKQPFRAPDALAFVEAGAPAWLEEVLSPGAVAAAGLFFPQAVAQLWAKAKTHGPTGQFSNADNMALVGVLTTQLLHRELVQGAPSTRLPEVKTVIDVGP